MAVYWMDIACLYVSWSGCREIQRITADSSLEIFQKRLVRLVRLVRLQFHAISNLMIVKTLLSRRDVG